MLSDVEIEQYIARSELSWTGRTRGDSLLVTLGPDLQELKSAAHPIDPYQATQIQSLYHPVQTDWDRHILEPGKLVLCSTAEEISLPPHLSGILGALSHVARIGLMTHLDSPFIDSGTFGRLTLELYNCGPSPIIIKEHMPVAKMLITQVGVPGERKIQRHRLYERQETLGSRFPDEFGNARAT
ncbi:dCTP deaminase [Streptosporangium sp. G11]|uniref:dCTP deaminase n=1 Tax=Streptosporangium sp. G11 TaxID=3436926 RepID=UPI003EBC44F4